MELRAGVPGLAPLECVSESSIHDEGTSPSAMEPEPAANPCSMPDGLTGGDAWLDTAQWEPRFVALDKPGIWRS